MEKDLDTKVRELLEKRRGDWPEIASQASVSHSWISKFVRGQIPKPAYVTLRDLHAYLSKKTAKA